MDPSLDYAPLEAVVDADAGFALADGAAAAAVAVAEGDVSVHLKC